MTDPDPTSIRSAWRTYRECLAQPVEATHRLIIQDDTIPCRNFASALGRVVAARPENPIVLFVGGQPRGAVQSMARACARDETFAEWPPDAWVAAVAIVWPVETLQPILDFVDRQRWPLSFGADDEILGRAVRALGIKVVATVPSLVEHPDVVESIDRPRRARAGENPDRVAWCFADAVGCDPLALDWK